jgi:predicted RNA-binding Zn-ribbon protein involved in translation (DUF1610 family)
MTGQAMARARSLTEFQRAFPDEASCAAFLFTRRWPGGFVCPVCGKDRAAVLKSRAYTYECSDCGRQTSITAGTALHRTKLPLTVWFWAAHLMSTHSNGMSVQIGPVASWWCSSTPRSTRNRSYKHRTECLAHRVTTRSYAKCVKVVHQIAAQFGNHGWGRCKKRRQRCAPTQAEHRISARRRGQLAVSTACRSRGTRFAIVQDARRDNPRLTTTRDPGNVG